MFIQFGEHNVEHNAVIHLSRLKLRSNRRIFGPYVIPRSGGMVTASCPTMES
jgi:hypothetical protein